MSKQAGVTPWPLSKDSRALIPPVSMDPKAACFRDEGRQGDSRNSATLEDLDRYLRKNFSSLFNSVESKDWFRESASDDCYRSCTGSPKHTDDNDDDHHSNSGVAWPSQIVPASSACQDLNILPPPGKSSSVISKGDPRSNGKTATAQPSAKVHASSTNTTMATADDQRAATATASTDGPWGGTNYGMFVVTVSKDPQDVLFRSMKETLDTYLSKQETQRPVVDWGFMQDLLIYYLDLNDPGVHESILQAFANLVADLKNRKNVILTAETGVGVDRNEVFCRSMTVRHSLETTGRRRWSAVFWKWRK